MAIAKKDMAALLAAVKAGTVSIDDAAAAMERNQGPLTCRVSQKGALSLYGLGRWPLTLYVGQWEKVLAHADSILAFVRANEGLLSRKSAQSTGASSDDTNALVAKVDAASNGSKTKAKAKGSVAVAA